MATMFGQGATYDAIEGRFRRYRKIADELRVEAQARGVDVSRAGAVPRTPRGPRNRVSKSTPSSSSSMSGKKLDFSKEDAMTSPSKGKGKGKGKATTNDTVAGNSDVICLDDGSHLPKPEAGAERMKTEPTAQFLPLTSPSLSTLPAFKHEQQDKDFDAESVTPVSSPVKVKAERHLSVFCVDEDSVEAA